MKAGFLLSILANRRIGLGEFSTNYLINDPNLVAYYKLEDLTDSSGNGNTLTFSSMVTSSATFTSAVFNNGSVFDNSVSSVLMLNSDLGITSDMTICGWVKLTTEVTTRNYVFFRHYSSTARISQLYYGKVSGVPTLCVSMAGIDTTYAITLGTINWYHITFIRSGSSSLLYINGILVKTGSIGTATTSTNSFYIGNDSGSSINGSSAIFDDVVVFSRALSVNEIMSIAK